LRPEDSNQPSHLQVHVALHGASVREAKFVVSAGGECVGDQGRFGRPPTVDGCLANIGVGSDSFNAQFGEPTVALEKLQGAAQDRLPRFLTTGAAGRTLPVGAIVSVAAVFVWSFSASSPSISSPDAQDLILGHTQSLI